MSWPRKELGVLVFVVDGSQRCPFANALSTLWAVQAEPIGLTSMKTIGKGATVKCKRTVTKGKARRGLEWP